MPEHEKIILERLSHTKTDSNEADWLYNIYSLELSKDLRNIISEKLGLLTSEGWSKLKLLLNEYGLQPELIYAAGICHQPEAKNWLINHLNMHKETDLMIVKALACWGASLPNTLIIKILKEPSQEMRLAGLELLQFKSHCLNDHQLLAIAREIFNDYRDPIIIKTIKILQRRDGIDICNAIAKIAKSGSDRSANAALMALGSIGNKHSYKILSDLSKELPSGNRLTLTLKQLKHQYRFSR